MKTVNLILKQIVVVITFMLAFTACQQKCEDFNEFFAKFNTNKEFQKSRVIFPFVIESYDIDEAKFNIDEVKAENWLPQDFSWNESIAKRETNAYTQEIITQNDTVKVQHSGVNNGINYTITFVCKDGKWFFYKFTNKSI